MSRFGIKVLLLYMMRSGLFKKQTASVSIYCSRRWFALANQFVVGIITLFGFSLHNQLQAQNVVFNLEAPTEMTVCGTAEKISIAFTNISAGSLADLGITVSLPDGVEYVPGSLQETSSFNVQEVDISDHNNLQFSANTLEVSQTIRFSIEAKAGFNAYLAHLAGNLFSNTVSINYFGGSDTETSSAYNIFYPALSITQVNPVSITTNAGEVFTRAITVVNGGYGALSSFTLNDVIEGGATIVSADVGTLNNDYSLTLTSADFQQVGNGNDQFEQNESVIINVGILVNGCAGISSEYTTSWGCNGQVAGGNSQLAYINAIEQSPDLVSTATPSFSTCQTNGIDAQSVQIVNEGAGPANNVRVKISAVNDWQYSAIDRTSIRMINANGIATLLTPINTNAAFAYDCLGLDAIDGYTVQLPSMAGGESVTVEWNMYSCALDECVNTRHAGWKYQVNYEDVCDGGNLVEKGNGLPSYVKNVSGIFEYPATLAEGEEGDFNFLITTADFNMPEEDGAYLEAVYDIPIGLEWDGNSSDIDVSFTSGNITWNPSDLSYDGTTRQFSVKYPLPMPNNFTLYNAELLLQLNGDCTIDLGEVHLGLNLYHVPDPSCISGFKNALLCNEIASTNVYCAGYCQKGMIYENFEIKRTSFGQADNDQNGIPDNNGILDMDRVKTNRVMVSDTFAMVFSGTVKTINSNQRWNHGFAKAELPEGSWFEVIGARVEIEDNPSGNTLVADNIPVTELLEENTRYVTVDFTPETLAANGNPQFNNYKLRNTDKVKVTALFRVVENPGGVIEHLDIPTEFYVFNAYNENSFQCGDWDGSLSVVGYYHEVSKSEIVNVNSCDKTVKQTYKLSVGPCCNNFDGGDIFPYEYRNWATLGEFEVEIPEGYSYVSARFRQWRTKSVNSSAMQSVNIEPAQVAGNTLTFDLSSEYKQNGGIILPSDDGFKAQFDVRVAPDCDLEEGVKVPFYWTVKAIESDLIGGSNVELAADEPDYVKYTRAKLETTTDFLSQEATSLTADWNITVTAKSAAAKNAWIYLDYDPAEMSILEVIDLTTEVSIPVSGDLYPIADFGKNDEKTYRVIASYTNCEPSEFKIITGYDCAGYPTNYSDHTCPEEELTLAIIPQPAELQVKLRTGTLGGVSCTDTLSVEVEMLSSKLSAVADLAVQIQKAASIELIPGSFQVQYPIGGDYSNIGDPVLSNGNWVLTATDLHEDLASNGLIGITDVNANIVRLRFNIQLDESFQQGDDIGIVVSGSEPCGEVLPDLAIKVDPTNSFELLEGIGLDRLANDWGMAWGDYNGDGFVDLYVTNYDVDQPNRLYKNNGNGTFSEDLIEPITTDMALSLAATWGDYDNDGDLDLFVTNNIGSKNWLYRNNGAGTFTKVLNDPMVNHDGYSHGASWADFDNDGYLDMVVTDYFTTRFNKLYRGNGDGTFSELPSAAPALENSSSVAAVWGDYDNDGWIDLFITNINNENNSLYKNQGNGMFLKITTGPVVNDGGISTGASWGDMDNDGDLDLFVANAGDQDNFLYQNNGDGTFTKITNSPVTSEGGHSHGSAWADFDNDGDLDLIVGNDAGNANFLYTNDGTGTFEKVENKITQLTNNSFGLGWADFDNDLDLDFYVVNHGTQSNSMFRNNKGQCQSKACIALNGTNSNFCGIGAKIFLKATIDGNAVWQMREVSSQSGGGIGGQNEMKTIFGLGDATIIDSIRIEWPSGYVQYMANVPVDDCLTIEEDQGGEICGVVYIDANGNCQQDEDEAGIPNMKIHVEPGDYVLSTDADGHYQVFVEPGEYTITQESNSLWNATCDLSFGVEVSSFDQTYCGNDFAMTAVEKVVDLAIEISTTPHRIGFENLIAITYCNMGTIVAEDIELRLDVGDGMDLLEASIPWDINRSETSIWTSLDPLGIGESNTIYVVNQIDPNLPVGTLIPMSAQISSSGTEFITANNTSTNAEPAVGAFDPNDILVSPEGYISNDQELTYTIRFQNVGNAAAQTVRIEDQLPAELDMSTFEMGIASHAYRLEILENNQLIWHFENINIPDSTSNEVESHGRATFRIKPKVVLEEGTNIHNSALIYFDNNPPIHTNVVINTIGTPPEENPVETDAQESINVFPNPTTGSATVEIVDDQGNRVNLYRIKLYSITGQKIFDRKGLNADQFIIDRRKYSRGYYIVRAIDVNGQQYVSKLNMQ